MYHLTAHPTYDVTSVRMTKPALTQLQRAFLFRQGKNPKIQGAAPAYQVSVVVGTTHTEQRSLCAEKGELFRKDLAVTASLCQLNPKQRTLDRTAAKGSFVARDDSQV
jgi:hypothetical protein